MKRLKRLVISSLLAVGALGTFQGNNVHAASGYQGMVGYRDGVLSSTVNEWHAGVFITSAGARNSSAQLIEAIGYNYVVQPVSYNYFLSGPDNKTTTYRKTGYKSYTTSADRDKIVSTAKYLSSMGSIHYTLPQLLAYNSSTGRIIYPGNITDARCDGVSEYCYEFNGIPIQGDPWDISTKTGQSVHNTANGMTPKSQASHMDSY